MSEWKYIILFSIFIIFIFLWKEIKNFILYFKVKEEHFVGNQHLSSIYFLTINEINDIILGDKDHYYSTFYMYDYIARGVKSLNEYLLKIGKSGKELNETQKERLKRIIYEIDTLLVSYPHSYSYFSPQKCSKLKWNIGYTEGRNYEGGLPHTRGDVIMLTNHVLDQNDEDLKGTLLHEKIHIYQKRYKEDTEKYIEEKKYRKWKRREMNDKIRANPDTDDYIYMNSKGEICKTVYNENPKDLEDTKTYPKNSQESEHPLENMAISLENHILSSSSF